MFYVYDGGQHGLIAATSDQSSGVRWHAGTYGNTHANGVGVNAGKANTASIIAAHKAIGDDGSTYAARICNEYSVTVGGVTYGDWYLPSKDELNLLYAQKNVVGGFSNSYYWSSTEYSGNNSYYVWNKGFNGRPIDTVIKTNLGHVRAIRAF